MNKLLLVNIFASHSPVMTVTTFAVKVLKSFCSLLFLVFLNKEFPQSMHFCAQNCLLMLDSTSCQN